MNRLPYATTLISICAAIALWLLAMYLEGGAPWHAQNEVLVDAEKVSVRNDMPVRIETGVSGCEDSETALQDLVANSQFCESDADCTLFDYGYPIQCLTSVAKSEITALRLEYRRFVESCEYRVYYDCPTGDMEREAVCRSNLCSVELTNNDHLEDETLEYLGIEP